MSDEPVTYASLDDDIKGIARRLDLFAEDSRTRFDLLTEKVVNGLTAITNQIATMALDVGQLMQERVDNRRRLDEHDRRFDTVERRIAALEAKPKRAPRPRKK